MSEAALEAMENELRKAQMAIGQVSGYDAAFASLQSCVSLLHTLRAALSPAPAGDAEIKDIRERAKKVPASYLRIGTNEYASYVDRATLLARVDVLAAELAAERARGERMRNLIRVLLENNPDDGVSDGGHTVLDLWRHDARAALEDGE